MNGVCFYLFLPAGTVCSDGGGACDSEGNCKTDNSVCASDDDCDDSNVCTINTCNTGTCETTNVEYKAPCGQDQFCTAGSCVECETATDCDDNNSCTFNNCADGTCENPLIAAGTLCDNSTGLCNNNGQCVPKLPVGAPCTVNTQCVSQECGANAFPVTIKTCKCNADAQCAGQKLCDGNSGSCVECLTDVNCGENEYCTADLECTAKLEAGPLGCTKDTACLSGECSNIDPANPDFTVTICACTADSQCDNVCDEATGFCEDCTSDDDCADTEYCSDANACLSKLAVGSVCKDSSECANGNCAEPTCQSLPIALKFCLCTQNLDCPKVGETICNQDSGQCVECKVGFHCGPGRYCDGNSECQEQLSVGAPAPKTPHARVAHASQCFRVRQSRSASVLAT